MEMTFIGGARYFVTCIYDFSRQVWLYVLKSKGNCFEKFKEFNGFVESQSEHKMKTFQLNNDNEFISKAFNHFLKDHSVEKQMSILYVLQQNGVAKRANCIIVEMTKNMLYAQNHDKSFWTEEVINAVYI